MEGIYRGCLDKKDQSTGRQGVLFGYREDMRKSSGEQAESLEVLLPRVTGFR